ncbi:DUF5667 domain-containing protein [Bacillus cytotoxicus]|uniref:DUF5667 domain-containing protein n=1 Tax=Bacillus cytotoxicus TaxID=580165 RepID=A0ACC6A2S2_9BACI|nr:DUF5667 domain-containing protein [Bacillus cytotoxicus]
MKKILLKGTMITMMACSPFLMGTAAYASSNTDAEKTTETEKPTLVQGDFFYFVKTMVEDIKMALANNDLDKAKLLSEQASERIAEADVLMEKGQDGFTQDSLEKAAENLEKADELSGEMKTEKIAEVKKEETEKPADETKTEVEKTADAKKEETKKPADKEKAKAEKVKVHIGHNIEALAKVLDKVKNPKAKEKISRNIEKSFAKIAVKIEKVQEKKEHVVAKENKPVDQNIEENSEKTEDTNKVVQPSQVEQSEQPAQPEQPAEPEQPAQSAQPEQPAEPEQPAKPAQPVHKATVSHENHEKSKQKENHEEHGKKVGQVKHEEKREEKHREKHEEKH